MKTETFKSCVAKACENLKLDVEYLSSIDAETGDGDHGITIGKISDAILNAANAEGFEDENVSEFSARISMEILKINGGAVIPLWSMMTEGIGEAVEGIDEITPEAAVKMFEGAINGVGEISSAKPGEKTLIDTLLPAYEAAKKDQHLGLELMMKSAAEAAKFGAESTKDMVARYGRAKDMREKSLGHKDPGAVSMCLMINYLYNELERM